SRVEGEVRLQRVAAVAAAAEQHGAPELVHHRQVAGEVDAGDLDEDRTEQRIGDDVAVEGVDDRDDVGAVGEVAHVSMLRDLRGSIYSLIMQQPDLLSAPYEAIV